VGDTKAKEQYKSGKRCGFLSNGKKEDVLVLQCFDQKAASDTPRQILPLPNTQKCPNQPVMPNAVAINLEAAGGGSGRSQSKLATHPPSLFLSLSLSLSVRAYAQLFFFLFVIRNCRENFPSRPKVN
jgi:hypothetical protein